jgi:hypothetical protein
MVEQQRTWRGCLLDVVLWVMLTLLVMFIVAWGLAGMTGFRF